MAGEDMQAQSPDRVMTDYAQRLSERGRDLTIAEQEMAAARDRLEAAQADCNRAKKDRDAVLAAARAEQSEAYHALWRNYPTTERGTFALMVARLSPASDPFDFELADARVKYMANLLEVMKPGQPVMYRDYVGRQWIGGEFLEGPQQHGTFETLEFRFKTDAHAAGKAHYMQADSGVIAHDLFLMDFVTRSQDPDPESTETAPIIKRDTDFLIGKQAIAEHIRKWFDNDVYIADDEVAHDKVEEDANHLAALGESGLTLVDCGLSGNQINAIESTLVRSAAYMTGLANPRGFELVGALRGVNQHALKTLEGTLTAKLLHQMEQAKREPTFQYGVKTTAESLAVVRTRTLLGGEALEKKAQEIIRELTDQEAQA